MKPCIVAILFLAKLRPAIRQAIIDTKNLKILARLRKDAVNTFLNGFPPIIERDDDRNQRLMCFHALLLAIKKETARTLLRGQSLANLRLSQPVNPSQLPDSIRP